MAGILWIAGAYFFGVVFPKIVKEWENEMSDLQSSDHAEYERFQTGLTNFFNNHHNTNPADGFVRV